MRISRTASLRWGVPGQHGHALVLHLPPHGCRRSFELAFRPVHSAVQGQTCHGNAFSVAIDRARQGKQEPPLADRHQNLKTVGFTRAFTAAGSCQVILECLENSYGHHEVVSFEESSIEHIMPQTLTPEWFEMLGRRCRRHPRGMAAHHWEPDPDGL